MALDLKGLRKEIPYKFKPQTCSYEKALIVAYIDSRDVQDLLDECVGPENWSDSYHKIGDVMYCTLSVNVTGDVSNPHWVSKSDCGVESQTEQEKGQASDALIFA